MADWNFKNSDNVSGLFFVDDQCIACDACVNEAPDFFRMNDLHGHAFVHHQPVKEEEVSLCESVLRFALLKQLEKGETL